MRALAASFLSILASAVLAAPVSAPAASPVAARLASAAPVALRIAAGRYVVTQSIAPSDRQLPTLLLMPGVNRGLTLNDPAIKALVAKGFGVCVFHFSVQPMSVAGTPLKERLSFYDRGLDLKDLAAETEAVADHLRRQGLGFVVPVSLSYSGAVTPFLQRTPITIETAPMTSSAAANPQLEDYRRLLLRAQILNPIFGPAITRASLDASYRPNWVQQADRMIREFKLPVERKNDMIEGYMRLSRATEGFAWENQPLNAQVRRVFVVAGEESPTLLRHQLATFRQVLRLRRDAVLFMIEEAGHVVPADQPEAYATALHAVLTNRAPTGSVVVVTPSANGTKTYRGADAEKWLIETDQRLRQSTRSGGAGTL